MINHEAYLEQIQALSEGSKEREELIRSLINNNGSPVRYSFAFSDEGKGMLAIGNSLYDINTYPLLVAQLEEEISSIQKHLHYLHLEERERIEISLKVLLKQTTIVYMNHNKECERVLSSIQKRK